MGRNDFMTELETNKKSKKFYSLDKKDEKLKAVGNKTEVYCYSDTAKVEDGKYGESGNFSLEPQQCSQGNTEDKYDTISDGMTSKRERLFGGRQKRLEYMLCMTLLLLVPLYTAVLMVSVELFAPKEQDGRWTGWGGWGNCSTDCGGGMQTRVRSCTKPKPFSFEGECFGNIVQSRICNMHPCADGGWSSWGSWSTCSNNQGVGLQSRNRSCSNPQPSNLGKQCIGNTEQVSLCNSQTTSPIDGGWSSWGSWSPCSNSQGVGLQSRNRSCSNPKPSNQGSQCLGNTEQVSLCNSQTSSPKDGGWSSWGTWGHCSNSNGVGLRSRHRSCNNPIPSNLGKQCLGSTEQVSICNTQTPSDDGTRRITKTLKVSNGGSNGDWKSEEFCPSGTFASGYNMKIEEDQGYFDDDTALNSIRLICTSISGQGQSYITSGEGPFGSWLIHKSCSKHNLGQNFLVGYSLQVESDNGDNTAANFIKFRCRDSAGSNAETELVLPPGNGLWGSWGDWSESCDTHSAICGITTKIQPDQGITGDDSGLNDVIFYCCSVG